MKNIVFEYHHVTQSDGLEDYTREKLSTLFKRNDYIVRADVFFKKENTTSDDTGMKVGIRLSAPGPRLFAEASHDNFKEAVKKCASDLKTQLEKRTDQMKTY